MIFEREGILGLGIGTCISNIIIDKNLFLKDLDSFKRANTVRTPNRMNWIDAFTIPSRFSKV